MLQGWRRFSTAGREQANKAEGGLRMWWQRWVWKCDSVLVVLLQCKVTFSIECFSVYSIKFVCYSHLNILHIKRALFKKDFILTNFRKWCQCCTFEDDWWHRCRKSQLGATIQLSSTCVFTICVPQNSVTSFLWYRAKNRVENANAVERSQAAFVCSAVSLGASTCYMLKIAWEILRKPWSWGLYHQASQLISIWVAALLVLFIVAESSYGLLSQSRQSRTTMFMVVCSSDNCTLGVESASMVKLCDIVNERCVWTWPSHHSSFTLRLMCRCQNHGKFINSATPGCPHSRWAYRGARASITVTACQDRGGYGLVQLVRAARDAHGWSTSSRLQARRRWWLGAARRLDAGPRCNAWQALTYCTWAKRQILPQVEIFAPNFTASWIFSPNFTAGWNFFNGESAVPYLSEWARQSWLD